MATITCADCGHEVETIRANTKICSVCRLIRDLPYAVETFKCKLCDTKYAGVNFRDPLCGDCAPAIKSAGAAECAFCHRTEARVRKDIAVCNRCARDPKLRKKLWGSIKRKQRERREANGYVTPAPEEAAA